MEISGFFLLAIFLTSKPINGCLPKKSKLFVYESLLLDSIKNFIKKRISYWCTPHDICCSHYFHGHDFTVKLICTFFLNVYFCVKILHTQSYCDFFLNFIEKQIRLFFKCIPVIKVDVAVYAITAAH